jgi:hypothetical protein
MLRSLLVICIVLLAHIEPSIEQQQSGWHYKFAHTKNVNSQFSIECEANDQIWIGWSHYGTRAPQSATSSGNPDSLTASYTKNSQLLNL